MKITVTATGALIAAGLATAATDAQASTLEEIRADGQISIGIRADYRPFGYLDPDGNNIGIEPDLARDLADRLGVEADLQVVTASNRMEFLNQGRVDVLISTMSDTEERRERVWFVEPNHYASGVNVMAHRDVGLSDWEDLEGLPICGIQGAWYNRRTSEDFGAEIVAFTGTSEVMNAMAQGECAGWVYDDSFIVSQLGEEEWAEYEMPLETIDVVPWGIAVRHGDDELYEFVSETIEDWHGSGMIIALEEEYGVEPIAFTREMHERYSE